MNSWLGVRAERARTRWVPALIAATTVAASVSFMGAGRAEAAGPSVTPGTVVISGSNAAGATSGSYAVSFGIGSSDALGSSSITFVAPAGTTFPTPASCSGSCSGYSVKATSGNGTENVTSVSTSSVNGSATPNQVTLQLNNSLVIFTVSGTITVTINSVGNPTHASDAYTIQESTSADTTPVSTGQYSIVPAAPSVMTIAQGSGQSQQVAQQYRTPLEVHLADAFGNSTPAKSVTFTAPTSGATVSFGACNANPCAVPTDSTGDAATTAIASQKAGTFFVTASFGNSGNIRVLFSLDNIHGPTYNLSIVSGNNQSALAGSKFAQPLKVQALDVYLNPVVGSPITFLAPSSGPGATFGPCGDPNSPPNVCVVDTDASGNAVSSDVTANSTSGRPYTVIASDPNASTDFQLTNLTGPPGRIVPVNGANQEAPLSVPFNSPLQVQVTDSVGNPVPGVTVTFSAPSSGATATFAPCSSGNPSAYGCVATTDSNGIATSSTLTASGSLGVFNVAVLVPGVSSGTFTLSNVQSGYRTVASDGGIFTFGGAPFYGSTGAIHLNRPIVGMADANGGGYYLVASDGGIFNFGPGAAFYGSTGAQALNAPIVGMAVDPQTGGYWLVASDGGVFAFNAPFWGSMGAVHLNAPIVGMAATPQGGYYLVASDGGIFTFGPGTTFYGSTGGLPLNAPIVAMATAPDGGYYLVASDGGIFTFGPGAVFFGSTGGQPLNRPIVGMSVDPSSGGYWLVASDGGIFSFGAPFFGSMGGTPLNAPMVGIAPST